MDFHPPCTLMPSLKAAPELAAPLAPVRGPLWELWNPPSLRLAMLSGSRFSHFPSAGLNQSVIWSCADDADRHRLRAIPSAFALRIDSKSWVRACSGSPSAARDRLV